ncbi:MAG: PIN domain-containing protein [Magnetococcales bacterium]|nr:PIN domain-containing protein [Magnetococcales bacterium]
MNLAVVLDSCILYSAPLRDLLLHLALSGLFQTKWSEEIHREWMENLLINRPDLTREQLEYTRTRLNSLPDCLVTGYESLISTLHLPDEGDRHVLAVAIHSRSGIILTYNLKDFPLEALAKHRIQARHPDPFIMALIKAHPQRVLHAVRRHRQTLKRPPLGPTEYINAMERQHLSDTADWMRSQAKDQL